MVECEIVCPRDLYHPVLMSRREGRLVGRLDTTRGTWASVELLKALDTGYTVTKITRALCSETCGGDTGLFVGYIDEYMKQKQRHSPTGEDPNPGAYKLDKMMVTSLWGKLGQQDINQTTRFYTSPETWWRTVSKLHKGLIADVVVHESNEKYLFATTTDVEREKLKLRTTSLMIAAFITANARLRLYVMLERLGERVMYHDTDSVIYSWEAGESKMPIGNKLGEWSDETATAVGPDPIMEYVGLGPKTYAFRTLSGSVCVKSKGFASGFTLEQYRSLAQASLAGEKVPPLTQERLQFLRRDDTIVTLPDYKKKLAVSLQKVAVLSATRTLPYGHMDLDG